MFACKDACTHPLIASQNTMRSLLLILVLICAPYVEAQTILLDAKTSSNATRLRVYESGELYLFGVTDLGAAAVAPVEGAGTRFQWLPSVGALRSGTVDGTQWDAANTGTNSIAVGSNVRASGAESVAFGRNAVASQSPSFAFGENVTASGAASVALGYGAHTNARQGSFVFADRSTVDDMRAGVNHSANFRVSGGFRMFTSSNLSTGITFQSGASVSNWGQSSAAISSSTGAWLSTGGVWTNASDVNRKHTFEDVSGDDILERLRTLRIQRWSYKDEPTEVRHLGPMAQDFYAAFGLGSSELSIGTVDADGVALASIQALDARTLALVEQVEALTAEVATLRAQLEAPQANPLAAGLPIAALLALGGMVTLVLRRRSSVA